LKPENLLFETPDPDSIIKITDFGFARLVNNGDYLTTLCGTPVYMAPEILAQGSYGKECDIWSIGVLIYFLLSGEHPFHANDVGDDNLFSEIAKGEFDFPEHLFGTISNEAKDLIRKCLNVNPSDRLNIEQIQEHGWFKLNS